MHNVTRTFSIIFCFVLPILALTPKAEWNRSSLKNTTAKDSLVFVTCSDSFFILNYDQDSTISEMGSCSLFVQGDLISVDGNKAVIAGDSAFSIVDISDPANPLEVGAWNMKSAYSGADECTIKAIELKGDDLFALIKYGSGGNTYPYLFRIGIQDPSSIAFHSFKDVGSGAQFSSADDMTVFGDKAYVSDAYDMGLQVFDISVKENISYLSSIGMMLGYGDVLQVDVDANYLYLYKNTSSPKLEIRSITKIDSLIHTYEGTLPDICYKGLAYGIASDTLFCLKYENVDSIIVVEEYGAILNSNASVMNADSNSVYVIDGMGLSVFKSYSPVNVPILESNSIINYKPSIVIKNNILHISELNGIREFEIIDLKGRAIFKTNTIDRQGVKLSSISSGVYNYYIRNIDGSRFNGKLIVK